MFKNSIMAPLTTYLLIDGNCKQAMVIVCLYLSGGTFEALKIRFRKLFVGAEITEPLKQEFFRTYGPLNDQFGIRWMFKPDKK
jgi:hypothetical protein